MTPLKWRLPLNSCSARRIPLGTHHVDTRRFYFLYKQAVNTFWTCFLDTELLFPALQAEHWILVRNKSEIFTLSLTKVAHFQLKGSNLMSGECEQMKVCLRRELRPTVGGDGGDMQSRWRQPCFPSTGHCLQVSRHHGGFNQPYYNLLSSMIHMVQSLPVRFCWIIRSQWPVGPTPCGTCTFLKSSQHIKSDNTRETKSCGRSLSKQGKQK